MQRLQFIWQLSRTNKRIVSVLIDIILIFMAFHLAILVRSGETNYFTYPAVWGIQIAVTIVTIAVFARLGSTEQFSVTSRFRLYLL